VPGHHHAVDTGIKVAAKVSPFFLRSEQNGNLDVTGNADIFENGLLVDQAVLVFHHDKVIAKVLERGDRFIGVITRADSLPVDELTRLQPLFKIKGNVSCHGSLL
jgi:hypothetical protein